MKQYVFRDSEFMSAGEKLLVQKAWVRFLKNGLRRQDFSDRLYQHLINHCGFIAHYSRAGYYATYFENGEDTTRFLSQFDKRGGEYRSVEYGGSWRLVTRLPDPTRMKLPDIRPACATNQLSRGEAQGHHSHTSYG